MLLGAALGTCVIAALVVVLLAVRRPKAGDQLSEIRTYLHLYEPHQSGTLTDLIHEFEQLFPQYNVILTIAPYQDMLAAAMSGLSEAADGMEVEQVFPDVVSLVESDLRRFEKYSRPPVPWSGTMWHIYYHKPTMEKLGVTREDLADLSWEDFRELMARLQEGGHTPISLGAQFGWPWLAWIQHLTLLNEGADAELSMDTSIEYWKEIESSGFVAPDYREKPWAPAVQDLIQGNGLFLLFDATIYRPLLPEERREIEYIPFPGSRAEGSSFSVGSFFYLAVPDEAQNREGAAALVDYLTSEGITRRFRQTTGTEIFMQNEFPENIRIIPSIATSAREPAMRPFLDWLRSHTYGD